MNSLFRFLILSLLIESCVAKFAYVTIHYEGTKRDDEYALAIRVWAKSLFDHGIRIEQDVIILVSENVRESTKKQFREIGCKLVEIKNIENPFKSNQDRRKSYKTHFEFTLNKLYVWNMLEYERVIYMDADNLFFHNIDELFKCGHFCAVYMNPCNFHTGLFVVTPNATTYNSLLKSLATLPSYDGADQGFLVAYFDGLQKAPLFDPRHPLAEKDMPAMQRLPVIYNNNHIFHYVEGHMDQFRVFGMRESSEPFYSLTYAIAPILKPWYWWGYPVLDMHWYWDQQRSSLHDNWTLSFVLRLACILAAVYANSLFVKHLLYTHKKTLSDTLCNRVPFLRTTQWYVWYGLSCGIALLPLLLAFKTMLYVVPALMPAHLALPLSVVYLYAWQWVAGAYMKLLRAFNPSLLRSLSVPRYWYWCLFWCVVLYFGLTFYMDCYTKIFSAFVFVYYLMKVTAIEGIQAFDERK